MGLRRKQVRRTKVWFADSQTWDRLRCGARTRAGGCCRAQPVLDAVTKSPKNGRCKLHGGLSTGPRTKEGLQRTLEAMRIGRQARRKITCDPGGGPR